MERYRVWRKSKVTNGGFLGSYDEPTHRVYDTKEEAERNCPRKSITPWGEYHEYYIKKEDYEI